MHLHTMSHENTLSSVYIVEMNSVVPCKENMKYKVMGDLTVMIKLSQTGL